MSVSMGLHEQMPSPMLEVVAACMQDVWSPVSDKVSDKYQA
jgi:hypothetical protein